MVMDLVLTAGYLMGGLFCLIMSFYLTLCFICWTGDMLENKKWRFWK